jgi:hypothetical protein
VPWDHHERISGKRGEASRMYVDGQSRSRDSTLGREGWSTKRPRHDPTTASAAPTPSARRCDCRRGRPGPGACTGGGSPSPTGASPHAEGSSNSPSAVVHSACMRFNGALHFPDPDSKGNPPRADPQHLGVSRS